VISCHRWPCTAEVRECRGWNACEPGFGGGGSQGWLGRDALVLFWVWTRQLTGPKGVIGNVDVFLILWWGLVYRVARSYHGISDVSFFLSLETMKQYTVSWYLTFILSVTHFHINTFSLPYLLTPTTDQKAGVLTLPSCMHHRGKCR